jgi:cytochrome c-type biogenesis protein CcmF
MMAGGFLAAMERRFRANRAPSAETVTTAVTPPAKESLA